MNIFKLSGTVLLLSSAFIITSCSSDGDGGSSGGPAAVPKDAIALTEDNAETVLEKAFDATSSILAKDSSTTTTTTATGLVSQIISRTIDNAKFSGIDLVSGIVVNETFSCETGDEIDSSLAGTSNTYTDNYNVTETAETYTASGTTTMNECTQFGVTLDGTVTWEWVQDVTTSEFTTTATASLTMTILTVPIAITNLAIDESGNEDAGDYVITKMQYTYNPGTGGFAVNMTTDIVGHVDACQPTAGVVEISGAAGSSVRITYSATGVLVEVDTGDGTYAEVTTTYFACAR